MIQHDLIYLFSLQNHYGPISVQFWATIDALPSFLELARIMAEPYLPKVETTAADPYQSILTPNLKPSPMSELDLMLLLPPSWYYSGLTLVPNVKIPPVSQLKSILQNQLPQIQEFLPYGNAVTAYCENMGIPYPIYQNYRFYTLNPSTQEYSVDLHQDPQFQILLDFLQWPKNETMPSRDAKMLKYTVLSLPDHGTSRNDDSEN